MITPKLYRALILLFFVSIVFSCGKEKPIDTVDPLNLTLEVTISEEVLGLVQIQASADNTIEYRLYIDSGVEAQSTSMDGFFEYTFSEFGIHEIEVRAYGSSGRYLKESRDIMISSGQGVRLEDGYMSPLSYSAYNLVWYDEFNASTIDTENWAFEIGNGCPNCGWGNNELQYYRRENTSVGDGVLTIEARKQVFSGSDYTSSRLISKNLKSFKYGRIDIRALLPQGQGIWPALWMLGNNISSVGWPSCGEIDIMELVGGTNGDNKTHGTIHWDNAGEHAQAGGSYTLPEGKFADEYHVFSIIWDESHIKWLMNDIEFYNVSIDSDGMDEFHQNFFFILNVAVGGNWPGNPDSNTVFPQQMKVDYIRVFQSK